MCCTSTGELPRVEPSATSSPFDILLMIRPVCQLGTDRILKTGHSQVYGHATKSDYASLETRRL